MPDTGDRAPDFETRTDTDEPFRLSSLQGQHVVLYFFPKANTPGWTVEAGEFRSAIKEFQKKGAVVLGISPDTPKVQAGFKEKQHLPFTLLSDPDKKIAEAYGVLKEKNMYGKMVMGIERSTFVIGPKGNIEQVFRKVKPEGHAKEVLAAIA